MKYSAMTNNGCKREAGFSLIEVMIAIGFLSVTSMALVSMQVSSIKGNSFAHAMTEASAYGSGITEIVSGMSYDAINQSQIQQLAATLPPKYLLDSVVQETDLDFDGQSDLKEIALTIHWKDPQKREVAFQLMIPKTN